jgi:hypothetical protein
VSVYKFPLPKPFNLLAWLLLLSFSGVGNIFAQGIDSVGRSLTIDLEVRPRTEFRKNYVWLPSDTLSQETFTTQRTRFNITYQTPRILFHASPQEIHIWGERGRFSRVGSVNFFELYAEPKITRHLSLRIGRQAVSLDNGRIFSAAPWAQQSRAHEGIRLLYKKKLETDLTLAFTRPYHTRFDPAYSPVSAHNYKFLFVHHLKHNLNTRATLTTINAMDVFQRTTTHQPYYVRMTHGGRIEYLLGKFYGTVNAYYQYGQNTASKKVRAYYVQPEIGANMGKITVKFGAEILSGERSTISGETTQSFVPLYGVAWKFMGNMNLFTRFPADVNGKGLINPYMNLIYKASKKLSFRGDAHLFYSQHPLAKEGSVTDGTYLGFESDLSLNYKPVTGLEVIFGYAFTRADQRMELLNKVRDADKIPVWSYLMVSCSPRLLNKKW